MSARCERAARSSVVRLAAALLAISVLVTVTSCSDNAGGAASSATPASVGPTTGTTVPVSDGTTTSSAPGTTPLATDGKPAADVGPLVNSGVQVVPVESDAATGGRLPLRVTRVQAERMMADTGPGAGVLGADVDALAPAAAGAPPTSYLVAAWVSAGTSASAATARGWMGEQDWTHAPVVHFPVAVLAMFVAEMARATDAAMPPTAATVADTGSSASSPAAGLRAHPAVVPSAPCSAVTGFLASVIQGLFNALRITPSTTGSGAFDFLASALATVWNVAVGLAQAAVQGLVSTLTAPVFEAIRLAVGALGVATVVISYFKDQTLDVTLDPVAANTDTYHFAVGAEPDVTGRFVATGRELTGDWPPALLDCARTAGATLPELLKAGIDATWTVSDGGVITPDALVGQVGADRRATLRFTTGRESQEQFDGGEVVFGVAVATVKIPRKEIDDFLTVARDQVTAAEAQLLSAVPAAAKTAAAALVASTIDPTLAQLSAEISGAAGGVFSLSGSNSVVVKHHTAPETTTSTPPSSSAPPDTGPHGEFCRQYQDLLTWVAANPPSGDVVAWANEIVRRLTTMRPAAPGAVLGDVDVELGVYTAVAASADVRVLIQRTLPLGNAANHVGTYCGLAPRG